VRAFRDDPCWRYVTWCLRPVQYLRRRQLVDERLQHEPGSSIDHTHPLTSLRRPREFSHHPLSPRVCVVENTPSDLRLHPDPATMSSGQVLKADKDFTKEVDTAIPEAEKLGSVCVGLLRWKQS
jgi:hypothetical protein